MLKSLAAVALLAHSGVEALKQTKLDMSMYNEVMFAQTNSEAESQAASCSNLHVHSVEVENVAPDASAYANLPSALRQRMARRYEARGEEVPLHLRDPEDV